MATVAEGVETEEQMARVVSDGCSDVQGYLISRPMRPEQIGSFLSRRAGFASRELSASAATIGDTR